MAKILPDREVRRLIGSVLVGADEKLINPNGIELRLGKDVLFHSTGEDRELSGCPRFTLESGPVPEAIVSDGFTENSKVILGQPLSPGHFLKVSPGESVAISSMELIDFKAETVRKILPHSMLMGFITPTTTMMREGISQVATKIDAGFRGVLNWGLRNGSTRDLILQYGEGSVPKSVEKERGASSEVIAPRIGFHRSPYSHDLEVA